MCYKFTLHIFYDSKMFEENTVSSLDNKNYPIIKFL